MRLTAPDSRPEGLADAQTHTNCDADYQQSDQYLDNDTIALAHVGEAIAVVPAHLGGLGFSAPMVSARPYLAVWSPLCALGGFPVARVRRRDDSFDVRVEGVRMMRAGRCRYV